MKVLVANLGSTSFKYRLFLLDANGERQLARGGADRIGGAESRCVVEIGDVQRVETAQLADHAQALGRCLEQLTGPGGCLDSVDEVAGIGFKAVHAGSLSGVRRVDAELLAEMERWNDVAPAHNPPYITAMRTLQSAFPSIPLVAAMETGFHSTIPAAHSHYAVPLAWAKDWGIHRWGFHGASHRYIASRVAELTGRNDLKIISCHLGGSSSLCAIDSGHSIATSMGVSPQSGLPQSNRVGDFDVFALPRLMKDAGLSLDEILNQLASHSGLAALSGTSGDLRDIEAAAKAGDERAASALGVYVAEIRRYLGGYLALLGGCDLIAFTGGIGENSPLIRARVCERMDWAGLILNAAANETAAGEELISADNSRTKVWTLPTNEEVVVARQTAKLLTKNSQSAESLEAP